MLDLANTSKEKKTTSWYYHFNVTCRLDNVRTGSIELPSVRLFQMDVLNKFHQFGKKKKKVI